ncbi:MAG: zinc-dependent alcohol dehydrogenase family protein [Acidobacteria bacterium]|nr:zinc-dependent alcohol dehydrogenase family protein [Acidobacteriota bacterium]MBI3662299.1 zinc-dependent alcohol dehydrogenase family protein [Acidobacteriota bacterium]
MKACLLRTPARLENHPLEYTEIPAPAPKAGEVLVRVNVCGVCRTDLHVVEGELEARKSPVIPGHQAVGVVEKVGEMVAGLRVGARVGVPWLHRTCGTCEYCRSGRENLCDAAAFTGWTADGGFAEYVVAPEAFVYRIPEGFGDLEAAPLLCAGIIGFRCLRACGLQAGHVLGMYGFGAAAHVAIQVARHWGLRVLAFTRDAKHQQHARELGAEWAGTAAQAPPARLDAAIIFAPAGELVIEALKVMKKGGSVVLGGIHSTPIPAIEYPLIYDERVIRSVANNTRADGEDFLRVAVEIPIRTEVKLFPLHEANTALQEHKWGTIRGAAVLQA